MALVMRNYGKMTRTNAFKLINLKALVHTNYGKFSIKNPNNAKVLFRFILRV